MHVLLWRTRNRCLKNMSSWSPSLTPYHLREYQSQKRRNSSLRILAMVTSSATSSRRQRAMCPNCSKPTRTCLCTRLQIQPPGFDNPVSVTVLQHSLEEKHPLNSTRILRLGLRNVTVLPVSDVNYGARFCIECWPEFSGGSLNFDDRDAEIRSTPKLGLGLHEERSKLSGVEWWTRNGGAVSSAGRSEGVESCGIQDGRVPVIDIAMAKKGAIRSIKHVWMSPDCEERTDLGDVLVSQSARDALAKGFLVRKFQRREVGLGMVELHEFEEFKLEVPSGSLLLFPSEEALTIDEVKETGVQVKNLIVLDGTWMKARRMYSENPWLRFLPHLKLDLDATSLYREVRSQSKEGYLSTVESVVYAIKALGNDTEGLNRLLIAFEAMVDHQRRCKDERLTNISSE